MTPIEIRPPASVAEYLQACMLVEQTYRGKLSLDSSVKVAHPKALLVAVKEGQVVGSMGFQSADQGPLPTEAAFGIALDSVCECPRPQVVEILRMAVDSCGAIAGLRGLTAAAIQYAHYRCSARYWLMTMKPTLPLTLLRYCHLRLEPLSFYLADPSLSARHPAYWGEPPVPQAWKGERKAGDVALDWLMRYMGTDFELHLETFDHHLDYSRPTSYET